MVYYPSISEIELAISITRVASR